MDSSEPPAEINVGRTIDDLERCLRLCPRQSRATSNALAILARWQYDESLTKACRESAGQLTREFGRIS